MKSQVINNVRRIHPVGTMNYCTKSNGNPSNNCEDISVWTKVVDDGLSNPMIGPTLVLFGPGELG